MEVRKDRGSFKTALVGENIWSIDGPANDLMYLVIGSRKAMLVDTGMGIGDLASITGSLTRLPVVVVNTHGHPDHAGGNSNFDEVWLSPEDEPIMRMMCTDEYRVNDIKMIIGETSPDFQHLVDGIVRSRPYKILPIQPGKIFDLGDRQFEVLKTPGHTPGSICLLNAGEKIIFTGDSIVETPVWLYLKHSNPLTVFHHSLKKIKARENDFKTLLPGHRPTPMERKQLDDLIHCSEEILTGVGTGKPTHTFAGDGLLWVHGKGQIIYDPEKLK